MKAIDWLLILVGIALSFAFGYFFVHTGVTAGPAAPHWVRKMLHEAPRDGGEQ